MRTYSLAIGFFLLGAACDGERAVGLNRDAIINGQVDQNAAHDAVVLLVRRVGGRTSGSCTATMVAPNLLLTARHCVSQIEHGPTYCQTDGSSLQGARIIGAVEPSELFVFTGRKAIDGMYDESRAVAKGAKLVVDEQAVFCNGDIAFVLLDQAIDSPIAPIQLGAAPSEGESITAVGWGLTETGTEPEERARRTVKIQKVGPYAFNPSSNVGLGASEFLVGEAFCFGDSGGPAFSAKGLIVGVASRSGNGVTATGSPADKCIGDDTRGFYTHLVNKKSLIDRAFAVSGFSRRSEASTVTRVEKPVATGATPPPAATPPTAPAPEQDDPEIRPVPLGLGCATSPIGTDRFGLALIMVVMSLMGRAARRSRR